MANSASKTAAKTAAKTVSKTVSKTAARKPTVLPNLFASQPQVALPGSSKPAFSSTPGKPVPESGRRPGSPCRPPHGGAGAEILAPLGF